MNYAQFKQHLLKRHHVAGGIKINAIFNLTNLKVVSQSEIAEGEAWICTIAPTNGKYLPQVIDIAGTTSRYAFKYDYTTGVIYIPSGEIIGDITITAVASDVNNNVAAVMQAAMTYTTTDGVTTYDPLKMDIYPCRGSTVTVTYGGVSKTVTGDIATSKYDSIAKKVTFETSEAPTSGTLTIEGAYEAYGVANGGSKTGSSFDAAANITSITNLGRIRYFPSYAFFKCALSAISLPDYITSIPEYAFYACDLISSVSIPNTVKEISKYAFYGLPKVSLFTIPENVTFIGDYAFYSNNTHNHISDVSLPNHSIRMLATTPPTLEGTADTNGNITYSTFKTYTYTTPYITDIKVPAGCGAAYKAAEGWSTFADYIVEA